MTFSKPVFNRIGGTIKGGTFFGDVTNNGTINGGAFYAQVTNNDGGSIGGGTYKIPPVDSNGEPIEGLPITINPNLGSEEPEDEPDLPTTGDGNQIGLWTALALIALCGMAVLFCRERRSVRAK